jgi:hypothetical protein
MSSTATQEDAVPLRLFDQTMTIEWIVLVEDFPGKAKERHETKPYVVQSV